MISQNVATLTDNLIIVIDTYWARSHFLLIFLVYDKTLSQQILKLVVISKRRRISISLLIFLLEVFNFILLRYQCNHVKCARATEKYKPKHLISVSVKCNYIDVKNKFLTLNFRQHILSSKMWMTLTQMRENFLRHHQ